MNFNRGVNEFNRGVNELNRGVNRSVARQGCNLRAAVTSAVTSQGCCCGNLQIYPLDLGQEPHLEEQLSRQSCLVLEGITKGFLVSPGVCISRKMKNTNSTTMESTDSISKTGVVICIVKSRYGEQPFAKISRNYYTIIFKPLKN